MVRSFISHAWHCFINAVLNVYTAIQFTATMEDSYWMLTASKWNNVVQHYSGLTASQVFGMSSLGYELPCDFAGEVDRKSVV